MTMVLAVGLGSSGCDLSGGSKFETITDAGISNAEEIDVSEEETLIVVETSEAVPETDESMGAGGFFGYNRIFCGFRRVGSTRSYRVAGRNGIGGNNRV